LALFAGAGGGILGGRLLGWRTVCAVEIEAYPRSVLLARQRDGVLEPFPIWDDVKTFDGREWRGCVDVVSGGFPCQDISTAGRGAGIRGERSGLWAEFARIIGEVQPPLVFVENSPMLVTRGLDVVLGDLACLGYDARWGIISAHAVGAGSLRKRVWIVAYPLRDGHARLKNPRVVACGWKNREKQLEGLLACERKLAIPAGVRGGIADAVADRVVRYKTIGNGQVPAVARLAWRMLAPDWAQ
jgi:DNA (cytosine-5)-methyltransferase 1